jgi:hypothetical protein
MADATVLLTSRLNTRFGTGFVVFSDSEKSFVVTCAHVVEDLGTNDVSLAGYETQVVSMGNRFGDDLAVIKVIPSHPAQPIQLSCGEPSSFELHGYAPSRVETKTGSTGWEKRPIYGKIKGALRRISRDKPNSEPRAWYLEVDQERSNGEGLDEGHSGSAVLNRAGKAFAVVSVKYDSGQKGLAISLEALVEMWKEMPKYLKESLSQHSEPFSIPSFQSAALTKKQGHDLKAGINKIKAYKAVHDRLHTLQRQSLEHITTALQNWTNSQDPPEISEYADRCQSGFDDLKNDLPSLHLTPGEIVWVDRDLGPEIRALRQAAIAVPIIKQQVNAAKTRLSSVVEIQMANFNRLLHSEAMKLPLRELRSSTLTNASLPCKLREIVERLDTLIYIHDRWQALDSRLQLLNLYSMDEFGVLWDMAKVDTTILCTSAPEYSGTLGKLLSKLDAEITHMDYSKIHERLRDFKSSAATTFYRVDSDLKRDVFDLPGLLKAL